MRKLLGTLTLLVLIIVGVGMYRGWFGISTDDQAGKTNVEVSVDKEKIKEDVESVSKKAKEIAD